MILSTEKLGKKYRIPDGNAHREVWALHSFDIEVQPGETIGIIGANGSGKSTLLKLLARVVHPTSGKITLNGRVGALLEVGTGFHMELNGKENIFLAGAILGMRRSEIKKHFDEILAFSEVEPYLAMPVKKYSSGMFLRLAFAVMAHLPSEILIVDEILAVGDRQFQKKCLEKMHALSENGRTIFLVSHQTQHIQTLCNRVIWLDKGACVECGSPESILEKYECKAALQLL